MNALKLDSGFSTYFAYFYYGVSKSLDSLYIIRIHRGGNHQQQSSTSISQPTLLPLGMGETGHPNSSFVHDN